MQETGKQTLSRNMVLLWWQPEAGFHFSIRRLYLLTMDKKRYKGLTPLRNRKRKVLIASCCLAVLPILWYVAWLRNSHSPQWLVEKGLNQRRSLFGDCRQNNFIRVVSRTEKNYIPVLLERWQHAANVSAKGKILYTIAARGDRQYTPNLLQITQDEPSETVRCEAYWALGKLGDPSVLEYLRRRAVRDQVPMGRSAAAEAATWISGEGENYIDSYGKACRLEPDEYVHESVLSLQRARRLWQSKKVSSEYRCPVLGELRKYRLEPH